ncbi:MAG: Protein-L-isoaspartate O-methyltransferase [Ignavibacteria bacterium]|nr:Protein-L-isoaspartate O-methyltransferase [Ignavibacteria bacterium]
MIDMNMLRRKELVEKLYKEGIKNFEVLKAIGKVKRELFVKEEFKKYAYDDIALPLNSNQTISQPYTVAFMTELLDIQKENKVLEVGTGSGYQAALLTLLGAEIYSIERIKELYDNAKRVLMENGYNVKMKNDDGTKGWAEYAPFDRIIVTAGSPRIPKQLLLQLSDEGKMVIPVGGEFSQEMILVKKDMPESGDDVPKFKIKRYKDFKFVPLIGEEGWSIQD